MEFNTFEIINLYKHDIIYKTAVSKRKNVGIFAVAMFFVLISAFSFGFKYVFTDYGKVLSSTISYIYDPVNPLYSDMGHIVFTSQNNTYNVVRDVHFMLPMTGANFTTENGSLMFNVKNNLVVLASADGVVLAVNVAENGQRYMLVKHSKYLVSRYENIDLAGVSVGQRVKAGEQLAIAKADSQMVFSLHFKNVPAIISSIHNNEILWEKQS